MRNKIVRNRSNVNLDGSQDFAAYIASLHRAVHALDSYFAASLDGELSQAEAVVLLHLGTSETTTINAVHKAFGHKRSTLTSVVDRLERKGLLSRHIDPDDRRNLELRLTAGGRSASSGVVRCVAALQQAMGVSSGRVRAVRNILDETADAAAR
jgi:DNA-binding MarR family transcriptional regulator